MPPLLHHRFPPPSPSFPPSLAVWGELNQQKYCLSEMLERLYPRIGGLEKGKDGTERPEPSEAPFLGGSLRTAACSLGADAPSLRVVGLSERGPSPRRRGAVLGLAGGGRNEMIPGKGREHEMTRDVSRSPVVLPTIVGERTSASDLVDGLGAPAVYGRITFANASAAQALMALTLDLQQRMSCTPHWQTFRENWGRDRHD